MIDYLASFVNTNGVAFPDTLTINSTGPSTTDGTELVKLFGDDIWGRFQAILDYAGLTPNGVTEGPGLSQHIEALQKGFNVGPGIIVNYPKAADPVTNGDRLILLTGQGILRASFPLLDAAVYVGDANNAAVAAAGGAYYRADDAAGTIPNIAGVFLILPDSRGAGFRGLDLAASRDPDGASRALGDFQDDQFQGHQHNVGFNNNASQSGNNTSEISVVGGSDTPSRDGVFVTNTGDGVPRTGSETRNKNISTNWGIGF